MTRDEKILQFFAEHPYSMLWCEPLAESEFDHLQEPKRSQMISMSKMCACRGCINGGRAHAWRQKHEEEPPITKEEFTRLAPPQKKEKPISFTFKSYKQ